MAGDWIKMRNDLAEDPAVIGIAGIVGLDEFAVVGRLHHLWSWVDRQSRDGHARGVTSAWLNRYVQCDRFAEAMVEVGWLVLSNDGIAIPNFERHNGETAKNRALATNRKARQRAAVTHESRETSRDLSRDMSRSERDESGTREEKRRVVSSAPSAPPSDLLGTPSPAPKPRKQALPANFAISDRVRAWAKERGFGRLDEHLDAFRRKAIAKGYAYVDWDAAFMEAIREDWAKLRGAGGVGGAAGGDIYNDGRRTM